MIVSCGSLKTIVLSEVSNNLASPPEVAPTLPVSSILNLELTTTGVVDESTGTTIDSTDANVELVILISYKYTLINCAVPVPET